MKKQDMIKLAIVGMMAGATVLGAQGTNQTGPGGSCNGMTPPPANGKGNTTQQAPTSSCKNTNGTQQQTPAGSCNAKAEQTAKRRGVDTSIRSSYSSSNQQNASANRAFDQKCGVGSCNGDEGTPTPPPAPQPGTGSARANVKRSTAK